MKWKQPVVTEKKVNPQMERINARKDSVLAKLQPELENMQKLLKLYVENMLQEKPSPARSRQIIRRAERKLNYAFEQICSLLWDVITNLSTEQKQQMLKIIDQPGNDNEFLNKLGNALNETVQ